MKKNKEKIIGNKKTISFELTESNSPVEVLNLNFYLGNKLISNESIYLLTYISSVQNLLDDIIKKRFENVEFDNLSSKQRFRVLFKERDSNEQQFFKHLFQFDETIDQYTIFGFQTNDMVRFVWTCWDKNNCNAEHELHEINSIEFHIKELILTLNTLIEILNKQLINMV